MDYYDNTGRYIGYFSEDEGWNYFYVEDLLSEPPHTQAFITLSDAEEYYDVIFRLAA